jgi:hypothetical protein
MKLEGIHLHRILRRIGAVILVLEMTLFIEGLKKKPSYFSDSKFHLG